MKDFTIRINHSRINNALWRLSAKTYEKIVEANGGPLTELYQWCEFTDGYMEDLCEGYESEFFHRVLTSTDSYITGIEVEGPNLWKSLPDRVWAESENDIQDWIKENSVDGEKPKRTYLLKKDNVVSKELAIAEKNKEVLVLLYDNERPGLCYDLELPDDEEFDLNKLRLIWDDIDDSEYIYGAQYNGIELEETELNTSGTTSNSASIFDFRTGKLKKVWLRGEDYTDDNEPYYEEDGQDDEWV